ncbi:sugar transferase [uncultured Prochlorococcus sp.]|uniref:sugar transferase n=1 Tax=uncultured Prochlorococcus sp. TaxID=159733 RepID=UPI00258B7606|nr:sugar transferase [uncultured Prochlorococcus sp.]
MNFFKNFTKKNIYLLIKSFLDVFFSLLVIIIGSPLFFIIAILIKFSSRGPIFYHHQRVGKNFKLFNCIKFRTMHPEADDILENLLEKNEEIKIEFEKTYKLRNDPRITRIGKFLRKTSLDELPQFINVLKMDMSVIGPRPIVEKEIEKYDTQINKVLSIKPGITGLWQVSGRNNLSYKKRIYLDSLYVENFNFIMDIRIIIRTFGVLLFPMDRGAY